MTVTVIIPVLDRPHRVKDLVGSIYASWGEVEVHPLFVTTEGDEAEQAAIMAVGADMIVMRGERQPGDYARKINTAYRSLLDTSRSGVDWAFLGADDLCFCPSWADIAIEHAGEVDDVVGTNDLSNPAVMSGNHATHSLVRVGYLGTATDETQLLHEGYIHNWVDREFVETAKWRGVFSFCRGSMVEHLHPNWGKAEMDDTYRLALDMGHFEVDRILFNQREQLWRV